ncbi:secretory carrier-associated membrane protein 1 isoform X3 [Strongylocentrotus purpuratus]|uniref:Secretory carrier-associated membrane protein n=1 Tax=Strongylocentrotus purpuratus TaxID=7668 RepID=A0A7M7N871_STRPU|nr:secretory carrier-associated membrane protein 1 isoform X3 [Strongylocentrotus purpuratus]
MSNFDSNPFADPQDSSPFQDPSVTEATANTRGGLEEFNPFEDTNKQQTPGSKTTPVAAPLPVKPQQQPAVMAPTSELPPAYTQSAAQPAVTEGAAELQRRQEELERKAAELTRREQQMRSAQYNTRENNWPPLPKWFPLQPCFFQDFAVDIPLEFQKVVKLGYYLWIAYWLVLFINLWMSLAYFAGIGGSGAGLCFGLAILFMVLHTPFSFVCWFRPLYKAFRSDSSFNFFLFFFIFFFQFMVTVVQAIGIDQFGTVGWVNGLQAMGRADNISGKAIAGCMLIIAALFTTMAVLDVIYLQKVHALYRGTGASFSKAQEEFAKGVVTNPGVQTATRQAAASAVSGATTSMFSSGGGGAAAGNNRM